MFGRRGGETEPAYRGLWTGPPIWGHAPRSSVTGKYGRFAPVADGDFVARDNPGGLDRRGRAEGAFAEYREALRILL